MNELRQSIMLDTEQASSKRRFGLFSQPPSTAIGDDSPFKQKHGMIMFTQPGRDKTVSLSLCRETCFPEPIVQASKEGASSTFRRASTKAINTSTLKRSITLTSLNYTRNLLFTSSSSNPHPAKKHSTSFLDKDPNTLSHMSTKILSRKSGQPKTTQAESSPRTRT